VKYLKIVVSQCPTDIVSYSLNIIMSQNLCAQFKANENPCTCPPEFPVCVCGKASKGKVITRKPILPGEKELAENSRSKSAKLRVFERA